MQFKSKLLKVHPQIDRGTFTSRKVWLETEYDSQYPQQIEVEVSQGKIGLFNNINPGAIVTVDINLRGRITEWKGEQKCFWTMSVWRVQLEGQQQPATIGGSPAAQYAAGTGQDDGGEGLPFFKPRTKPALP